MKYLLAILLVLILLSSVSYARISDDGYVSPTVTAVNLYGTYKISWIYGQFGGNHLTDTYKHVKDPILSNGFVIFYDPDTDKITAISGSVKVERTGK